MNKALEAEGVGDQADLTAAPDPGQRQLLRQGRANLFLGDKTEWQLITAGLTVPDDIDFT